MEDVPIYHSLQYLSALFSHMFMKVNFLRKSPKAARLS